MRRADRLFQIIQILRRARGPMTSDAIAIELETSKRTVYRDIAALIGQRVPIRGEAGIGYVLDGGFDLPPLMLTSDELEAAVLGAQWVAGQGDPVLARAAQDLIAKISVAVPPRLRPYLESPAGVPIPPWNRVLDTLDVAQARACIHAGRKIRLLYTDEAGQRTDRVIWPVAIGYRDAVRTLVGWCELREDFRVFRTDRVREASFLEEVYPERRAVLRARWRKARDAEQAARLAKAS